jgi:hypothetical protein
MPRELVDSARGFDGECESPESVRPEDHLPCRTEQRQTQLESMAHAALEMHAGRRFPIRSGRWFVVRQAVVDHLLAKGSQKLSDVTSA